MKLIKDCWNVFVRHLRSTRRLPVFLFISIIQPALWLFLFGQLFGVITTVEGFNVDSYPQFLAPALAVMAALFSSSFIGVGLLVDMQQGVLTRLLVTPVGRGAIIIGRIMDITAQALVQALVLLGLAMLTHARPVGGVVGILVVLGAAILLSGIFASLSNLLALVTLRQEAIIAVMNFISLPMTFTSSMIIPHDLMPGWIRMLSRFNPLDWGVSAARIGYQGGPLQEAAVPLAMLAGLLLVTLTLTIGALKRYERSL